MKCPEMYSTTKVLNKAIEQPSTYSVALAIESSTGVELTFNEVISGYQKLTSGVVLPNEIACWFRKGMGAHQLFLQT